LGWLVNNNQFGVVNEGHRFAQSSDLAMLRAELSLEDRNHLSLLLDHDCLSPDWILLGFDGGRLTEALALVAPCNLSSPVELIRLHGWFGARDGSLRLFECAIDKAHTLGARELYCTALQNSHDGLILLDLGFRLWRRIMRFEHESAFADVPGGVEFVSSSDFERSEIIALIAETSAHSADLQIQDYRRRLGASADAEMTLQVMESTKYYPNWWRVALDSNRRAIGIIFPVIAFGESTVGFVGVIQASRRRGIAAALLAEAWTVMNREGYECLSAETDEHNFPMQRALTKSGFALRSENQEWKIDL
jgi:ribosomal protein S18 acetylase RimI-like enzyme